MYICFYWKTYIQSVNYSWYQSNTNKQKTSISCWRAFEKLFIMTFIYISQYLTLQSMVAILASNETFSVDWITRCFIMTMATPIFTVVTIESFWTGWKTRIIFEKKIRYEYYNCFWYQILNGVFFYIYKRHLRMLQWVPLQPGLHSVGQCPIIESHDAWSAHCPQICVQPLP